MKGKIMTTPASTGRDRARREDCRPALPAGRYPATGQPATTTAAMRAAADLIDRSGIAGLSVTCSGEHILIQVPRSSGNAQSRAATVARLAGYLGSIALQGDNPAEDYSCIKAHGTAAGLPVDVFTVLTAQQARTDPDDQRVPLAAHPDGRLAQVVPPARLPDGWRWLTDLDCPQPVTGAALKSAASTTPAVQPRASTARTPLESAHPQAETNGAQT
jgi:hypothetical protein